ncbi:hypothetical protein P154DRAFT_583527 [Amniculicola lignicola CBS 123094]|uniref:Uncharacterized protein n=1 Tax=Amniculicola lignicola CBS 123094 TaxID=1392246 RepID=A0A6A5VVM5_9PLEO|nr:hypothetical protein P154DRAFT_583527 [Amniculicola lignicola CBS 123094]
MAFLNAAALPTAPPTRQKSAASFSTLPEELILQIAGELLASGQHLEIKAMRYNSYNDWPAEPKHPLDKYQGLYTFCQVSKLCRRIGQELLFRHCDLTNDAMDQTVKLLRTILLDAAVLGSKVHSLKLGITYGEREQGEEKELTIAMLRQADTMLRNSIEKILDIDRIDDTRREPYVLLDALVQSRGIPPQLTRLQALETLILRGYEGFESLVRPLLQGPDFLNLPRLKELDLRCEFWDDNDGWDAWHLHTPKAELWNIESLTLRGWFHPGVIKALLQRLKSLKSLRIAIRADGNPDRSGEFDLLWTVLLESKNSLESLEIVFKRRWMSMRRAIWPFHLIQFEKMKTLKIGGGVMFNTRLSPDWNGVDNLDELSVADQFFPPNLEHFIFAPDLISLGAVQDARHPHHISRAKANAMELVTHCFKTLLRHFHHVRPSIRTFTIPSSWYSPENFSKIELELGQYNIKLLRQDKKEELLETQKRYGSDIVKRPGILEQLSLYGGVEDNHRWVGELSRRHQNRKQYWREREQQRDRKVLGAQLEAWEDEKRTEELFHQLPFQRDAWKEEEEIQMLFRKVPFHDVDLLESEEQIEALFNQLPFHDEGI